MQCLQFGRYVLGLSVAVALLAGCGGASQPSIGGAPAAVAQNSMPASHADAGRAALLYVSEPSVNRVSIYAYPSLAFKAQLSRLRSAAGLCSDPRTGNVWVIAAGHGVGRYKVFEFAHGGTTPIRTLNAPYPELNACSVNPRNGDLAVVQVDENDDLGGLFIYTNGTGKPSYYQDRRMLDYNFVGYDASGNAFVDGQDFGGHFRLDELVSGGTILTDATPAGLAIHRPGGVQYDGTYMTVGNQERGLIYRVSDKKVVGTTNLLQTCLVRQFAIYEDAVIVPSACRNGNQVLSFNYPAGGTPTREVSSLAGAFAATVSR